MKSNKLHLSSLMFFQLCVTGAFLPILSLYLKDYLGFSSIEVGVILSISSLPSIVVPIISIWFVDRLITSRKFMLICHFLAAVTIIILSLQSNFIAVLIIFTAYMALVVPTFGLVNSLIFHNLKDSSIYSFIRMWGTIGWAISGWLVSLVWKFTKSPDNMPYALFMSGLFSVIVIILTLRLPKMKLDKSKTVSLFPKESFSALVEPKILLMLAVLFITSIADKFYFFGTPIFLDKLGVSKDYILIAMSVAQVPEMIMLFFLAPFIKKIGFKNAFIISIFIMILRFTIFNFGNSVLLSITAIGLGGFLYALFFAGVIIYLDNNTPKDARGGVHQIFNFFYVGISGLLGNYAAGWVAEKFTIENHIDFRMFWTIPSVLAAAALFLLIFFMKKDTPPQSGEIPKRGCF